MSLAACGTDDSFGGSYNGTLTLSETGAQVVVTSLANIQQDQDDVEVFSSGNGPNAHCLLAVDKHSGSEIQFDCATTQCFCEVDSASFTVTAASGTLSGDQLALAFSGTDSMNAAFSAMFTGTLEPGTR